MNSCTVDITRTKIAGDYMGWFYIYFFKGMPGSQTNNLFQSLVSEMLSDWTPVI